MNTPAIKPSDQLKKLFQENDVFQEVQKIKLKSMDRECWRFALKTLCSDLVDLLDMSYEKILRVVQVLEPIVSDRVEKGDEYDFKDHKQYGEAIVCLVLLRIELPELYRKFIGGNCISKDVITKMFLHIQTTAAASQWENGREDGWYMEIVEKQLYRVIRKEDQTRFEVELYGLMDGSIADSKYLVSTPGKSWSQKARHISDYLSGGEGRCKVNDEVGDHRQWGWLDLTKIANIMALAKGS